MKVLICGSRTWNNINAVRRYVRTLNPTHDTIIHGGARGADSCAHVAAVEHGIEVRAIPADWKRYGRGAGHIRNETMLDEKPDLVVYFHADLTSSKGTKHMVKIAREAGVKVIGNPGV